MWQRQSVLVQMVLLHSREVESKALQEDDLQSHSSLPCGPWRPMFHCSPPVVFPERGDFKDRLSAVSVGLPFSCQLALANREPWQGEKGQRDVEDRNIHSQVPIQCVATATDLSCVTWLPPYRSPLFILITSNFLLALRG